MGIFVGPDYERPAANLTQQYRLTTPATVGHFLNIGFADPSIRPVYRGCKVVGPAFTVRTDGMDIAGISKAYELVKPGDVLVVDTGGDRQHACAGEVSTFKSIRLGIAGLIVDGAVTDTLEFEALGFPCFSRTVSALVGRRIGNHGAVRVPVQCGGVVVNPGDIVVADDNGIVFLSPAQAAELLPTLLQKEADEKAIREEFWEQKGQPVPVFYK
ncbi:MAG TPA: hypothetical protein VD969_16330 [Symbiobacteriaceae bacterium]|nr:hypothetical protein [Symbiobacteriaceae bacterium]